MFAIIIHFSQAWILMVYVLCDIIGMQYVKGHPTYHERWARKDRQWTEKCCIQNLHIFLKAIKKSIKAAKSSIKMCCSHFKGV